MALSVTHSFVSGIADDPAAAAAGEVVPSNWNDTHTLTGIPYIDPTSSTYNASGSNATTTGTIISGTNSLSVASATGWTVGMGIAVANAGTGGNTDLISYITAISGTTFTLNDMAVATATSQTVNHDDTVAISAAITAALAIPGGTVYLPVGNYNITSALTTITGPIHFYGDGNFQTVIWNRGTSNNIFVLNYAANGGHYHDFTIRQATISPSAGYGFYMSSGTNIFNLVIENINLYQLYNGMFFGSGLYTNVFSNITAFLCSNIGFDYNCPPSSGDNTIINCSALNCGVYGVRITASDTDAWVNLKVNGNSGTTGILFNGSSSTAIGRVRFINPSLEGAGTGTGVDFGSNGATGITFVGGEISAWTTNFANTANLIGGSAFVGIINLDNTSSNGTVLFQTSGEVALTNNENSGYLCFNGTNDSTGTSAFVQFQLNNNSGACAVGLAGSNWTPAQFNTYPDEMFFNNTVGAMLFKTGPTGAPAIYCDYNTGQVVLNNDIGNNGGWTVATIPTGIKGGRGFVTDSTLTMAGNYGATIAGHGSGANVVPIFFDGTSWRIG